jgi:hypothetical protein
LQSKRYLHLLGSLVLFVLLWLGLYPYMQYLLDADAVGYLTIARRVANADWFKSINGLWSPLNSWLLVPFIKNGYNSFTSALVLNAVICASLLVTIHALVNRFVQHIFYKNILTYTLPIVLVYYSYFQVFGDALQLLLVSIYLLIITSANFWGNWQKYLASAVIMGIGFYAKAYSLPFFILHFTAIHIWHWWQTKQLYIKPFAVSIITILLMIMPWSMQLSKKYNQFSLMGNAGKLNMSWYLLSSKSFKPEIKYLIPPTYADSPSFWEDPYLSQSICHTPTESLPLFIRWIARIIHTCLQAIGCMNEISCFVIPIILASIIYLIRKNKVQSNDAIFWSMLLVPIGYLTMHIETRYIWLMMIGAVIFAGIFIEQLALHWQQKLATIIFCLSLIVYPIYNLIDWRSKGKTNFAIAKSMSDAGIQNQAIVSNSRDLGNMWVTAYLSHNQLYSIENFSFTDAELSDEIKRYKIAYYIQLKSDGYLNIGNKTLVAQTDSYSIFKITP